MTIESLGLFVNVINESRSSLQMPKAVRTLIYVAVLGALFFATGCEVPRGEASAVGQKGIARPSRAQGIFPARFGSQTPTHHAQESIRTKSEYRRAVAAYSDGRYTDALHIVKALLVAPGLSTEDTTFLARQKQLCQAAADGKPVGTTAQNLVAASGIASARNRQTDLSQRDCGPRALLLLCKAQQIPATLPFLLKSASTDKDGTSMDGLASAAQSVGFRAEGVQMDKDALTTLTRPAIAWVDGNHYVAVLNVHTNSWTGKTSVTIHDPNKPEQEELSPATLLSRSGGVLLVLSPAATKKAS